MWFKLSLLLLLIFCSCNVSSKNLRKSLNQKVDDYNFMEDSFSPNAAPDVEFSDGFYNGYGGEVRGKQHHVLKNDSSNLNRHIGKQNGHKFDGSNFDKQHKDILAEIQHNGYSGNKEETPAMKNDDSIFLSNNDKFGKEKHGRFRRGYYDWDTTTVSSVPGRTITVWGIGMIVLVVFLPLLFCCCIIGLISWAVYAVAKQNRHVQPGVVYQ
uniref:Uncharacterized protein n=1 Tax=Panagrolaimus davidi TaxID=227884 RepID=A0A914PGW0_9BILA